MKFEKIISYTLHPIVLGVITTIIFFILQPKYTPKDLQIHVITIVFISTYLIPVIFLFLLKKFKAIDSFHLSEVEERKFPVFFFIILNLLLSYRLYKIPNLELLSVFFGSSSLSLILVYFFLLLNKKISLHTLGFGLFTTFLLILSYHFHIKILVLISFAIITSGIVAMSRLKLKAHNPFEIYLGFAISLFTEVIFYKFLELNDL